MMIGKYMILSFWIIPAACGSLSHLGTPLEIKVEESDGSIGNVGVTITEGSGSMEAPSYSLKSSILTQESVESHTEKENPCSIIINQTSKEPRETPSEVKFLDLSTVNFTWEDKQCYERFLHVLEHNFSDWKTYLDHSFRWKIFNSWRKNPEKFDPIQLQEFGNELSHKLEKERTFSNQSDSRILLDLIENLEGVKKRVSNMIQFKILELGGVDLKPKQMELLISKMVESEKTKIFIGKIPKHLIEDRLNKESQKYASLILKEMEKMENKYESLKLYQEISTKNNNKKGEPFWVYYIQLAEFLYRNEFITTRCAQKYLKIDQNTVPQFHNYISYILERRSENNQMIISKTILTEDPLLLLSNKVFKVLNIQQAAIINFYHLVQNVMNEGNKIFNLDETAYRRGKLFRLKKPLQEQEWRNFLENFSINFYLKMIMENDELEDSSHCESYIKANFHPNSKSYNNRQDVESLIKIILLSTQENKISRWKKFIIHSCELLNFIDHRLFLGIMKDKSRQLHHTSNFEEKFKILLLHSRIKEAEQSANDYYAHFLRDRTPQWNRYEYRSTYETYCNKMAELLPEFVQVYSYIHDREDTLSRWLSCQYELVNLYSERQTRFTQLRSQSRYLLTELNSLTMP